MKKQIVGFAILILSLIACTQSFNLRHIRNNPFGFGSLGNFGFPSNFADNNGSSMTSSFSSFSSFGGMTGNNTISKSFSSSKSFVSSNINGVRKEEGMETEEFRNKDGSKPEVVRKYGEVFKKNHTDPALLLKRGQSNVEEENIFFDKPEVKKLDQNEEKVINSI